MAATAVIYILWGATIGVAARTTIKALRTEHPLARTKATGNAGRATARYV